MLNQIVKSSINSMLYLLLRLPIEEIDGLRELYYSEDVIGEVETWTLDLQNAINDSNPDNEVICYITEVIFQELKEGTFFASFTPGQYFDKLREFVIECTTDDTVMVFIKNTYYNSCALLSASNY